MNIIFNCRDNKSFSIPLNDFYNMEEFFLKNLVVDTISDNNKIDINEDYNIVKSIVDSIRLNTLIYNHQCDLRYMKAVSEKWCVPVWLLDMINDELQDGKIFKLSKFINNIYGNTHICKICHCGFKIDENGPTACRSHYNNTTMQGSNNYACCNKEEPCLIGYHVYDTNTNTPMSLVHIINNVKDLL